MKHWKRRKKKYALDPILCGEQLRRSFDPSIHDTYALKT
jgi:hypothetical protein